MSDRTKAGLLAAGASLMLSALVGTVLLLGLGVLAGRLTAPSVRPPGSTTIVIPAGGLPGGPGALGPAAGPALAGAAGPGGPGAGGTVPPGTTPPGGGPGPTPPGGGAPGAPSEPVLGLRVRGEPAGLAGADVPVSVGESSGGANDTSLDVAGVNATVTTSEQLLEDTVCLVLRC